MTEPQITGFRHQGYFQLCMGSLPADFTYTSDFSQDGQFNQWLYMLSGSGSCDLHPELVSGTLYNFESAVGQQVTFTSGSLGAEWIAVNPMHLGDRYDCAMLDPAMGVLIETQGWEHLVVFAGSVTVDGQIVEPRKAYLLEPGKKYLVRTDRAQAAHLKFRTPQ